MEKEAKRTFSYQFAGIFANPGQIARRVLDFFSQLKLALFFMFSLAILTLLGTIIEQKPAEQFHPQSQTQEIVYAIITFLHLNEVFQVWYFKVFLIFFAFSIFSVTMTRVIPSLRFSLDIKSKTLDLEGLKKLPHYQELKEVSFEDAKVFLTKRKYKFRETPVSGVYVAEKGLWTRFSALMTHLTLLLILGGVLMAGLGFKGNLDFFPGQIAEIPQVDWKVRLVDFWLDHRPDGTVRQFNSVLQVIDKNGQVIRTKHIWVNEPLIQDGVYFYQATFVVAGYRVKIGNKEEIMEMGPLATGAGFATHAFELGKKKYILYSPEANANTTFFLELTDSGPVEVGSFDYRGKSFNVGEVPVQFIEPVYFSGLSVKRDPGIPVIYLGFFLITISIGMAFFPYKTLWLAVHPKGGVVIGGRSNKAKYHFEKEFNDIINKLQPLKT